MLFDRDGELGELDAVLDRRGVAVIEGPAGIGKTALLKEASARARERGYDVVSAAGSELEVGFAYGIVRQLFERRLAMADSAVRHALLAGGSDGPSGDSSFGTLHALYWLVANLSERQPLAVVVDDVHWADQPSLRWLAHLVARVDGLPVVVLVGQRRVEPAVESSEMAAVRARATVVRPGLLSESSVTQMVGAALGAAGGEWAAPLHRATGGNPFYVNELLRGLRLHGGTRDPTARLAEGNESITRRVLTRINHLDPAALALAQSFAILGDGCEFRLGAALAGVGVGEGLSLAADLVRSDVLAAADPVTFLHPVIRGAVEASMGTAERHRANRAAAALLFAEGAPAGQVAAHLVALHAANDPWVVDRLREAAKDALAAGAPHTAADLLQRALAEPPPASARVHVLLELARAEASAGRDTASGRLEEARRLLSDPSARSEIALEMAETLAGLFRWVDAVDVVDTALAEVAEVDSPVADRLRAQLVVAGVHDARRASRVAPILQELVDGVGGPPRGTLAVATGMAMALAGRPAEETATVLGAALEEVTTLRNWDTRAALFWSLITVERFDAVASTLEPMLAEVRRSGNARGLVATYSSLALLQLRLGALPEADAAARIALRVLQESDFAPGLPFGVTLLAEVAIEAGELNEAAVLLDLVPHEDLVPGVGTVLTPAARARLKLAQGRPAEALAEFEHCAAMFATDVWGVELRDVGYLHARSGAAYALLQLGRRDEAAALARAELSDVRRFGGLRALGVACRSVGLVEGGPGGIELLTESVNALASSPARLERAKSLAELGAAMRRRGQRQLAREPLAEALDLAARCGARPLAARAREELAATGSRPRREWRRGVEALTPTELRVARLAADGNTNRAIAQAMYVTVKTVEGHLAGVYRKLDIVGRPDLAEALQAENSRVVTR